MLLSLRLRREEVGVSMSDQRRRGKKRARREMPLCSCPRPFFEFTLSLSLSLAPNSYFVLSSGSSRDEYSGYVEPRRSERREKKDGKEDRRVCSRERKRRRRRCGERVEEKQREREKGCACRLLFLSLSLAPPSLGPPLPFLHSNSRLQESQIISTISGWAQRSQSNAASRGAARASSLKEKNQQKSFFFIGRFNETPLPQLRPPARPRPSPSLSKSDPKRDSNYTDLPSAAWRWPWPGSPAAAGPAFCC